MKIEEVDLVSLRDILRPAQSNIRPVFSIQEVEQMEREVVSVLKFKLLPDTLYFWFDLAVMLWDVFVSHEALHSGYHVFKPKEVHRDPNKYKPEENGFQLSIANRYRVGVQALDLMSLDFEIHEFSRPKLVLATLALIHMQDSKLLTLYPHYSVLQL